MAIQRAARRTGNPEKTAYQTYMELKQRQNLSQTGAAVPTFAGNFAAGMEAGLGADAAAIPRAGTLQGVSQGANIPVNRSYDPAVSGNYNTPGAGMSAPGGAVNYNPGGSTSSDAHEALYQAISEAEGTTKYGYNTVYGGGNGIAGKPLTGMTIREVLDHQSKMIQSTSHSPLGRFQITRDTLREHYKKVGLSLDSKFDQAAQNKLALSIANTQGLKPTVWAGFKNNPTALARAKNAYSAIQSGSSISPTGAGTAGPASKSSIMAMQRDLNSKGANLKVDGIIGPNTQREMTKYGYSTPSTSTASTGTAYQQYMAKQQPAGAVNTGGIQYSIRDKTSAQGLTPGLQGALGAAQNAARAAGLDHISVVAGKGQGHLSHAQGSEADVIGYNKDGSVWSKVQRVAVAQGAAGAGANRFGFYSGNTLHMGMGAPGLPKNVVWNNQVRGQPGVTTFAPEERDFVNGIRTGKPLKTTYPTTTTAAANVSQPTGYNDANKSQVQSIQRELQARGATDVKMDGIVGPKTRAAAEKYGMTKALSDVGKGTIAGNRYAGLDTGIMTDASTAPPSASVPSPAPLTGRDVPQTSYLNNPYTNSTGGANALGATRVPTTTVKGDPFSTSLPSYNRNIDYPNANQTGARAVPTTAVSATGMAPVGAEPGKFNRPVGAGMSSPYVSSNSLKVQTVPMKGNPWSPHLPGADNPNIPSYTGTPIAVPTTSFPVNNQLQWSQLQAPAQQAVPTAAGNIFTTVKSWVTGVGSQARDAFSQGSRNASNSGMGYSGGSYSGGSYGSAAGRSISEGVGGAFKNR